MHGGTWTIGFSTTCRDPEHDTGKCRDYNKQAGHFRSLAVPVVSEQLIQLHRLVTTNRRDRTQDALVLSTSKSASHTNTDTSAATLPGLTLSSSLAVLPCCPFRRSQVTRPSSGEPDLCPILTVLTNKLVKFLCIAGSQPNAAVRGRTAKPPNSGSPMNCKSAIVKH